MARRPSTDRTVSQWTGTGRSVNTKNAERDGAIFRAYCSGRSQRDVAAQFNVSQGVVSTVVKKAVAKIGEADLAEYRVTLMAQLNRVRSLVDEVAEAPAPPAFTGAGAMLLDENCEVVRDYSARLNAAKTVAALIDRQVKILGLEAPDRVDVTVTTTAAAQAAQDAAAAAEAYLNGDTDAPGT